MNMFKPVKAKSVKEYFDMLPEERRAPIEFLHKFIQKTVPKLKPVFVYNMPGYGGRSSIRTIRKKFFDWPVIGLASQKNYISVYVCAIDGGEYIAEKNKKDLGKVSVGRSYLVCKKIEDLNLKTFAKVLKFGREEAGAGRGGRR